MYTSSQFAEWSSCEWTGAAEDFSLAGVCHDTRTLQPGDAFVAIRGEQFDGHDFIAQAVEKGAACLIVDREMPGVQIPQLVVRDTLEALWMLARGARGEWSGTVIGLTGSAGKTTVKEMVASVLSRRGSVSKTPGNWNNDIGLPLSMLAADPASDWFVFELGMNHPGEIDRLAGLLSPDWAAVTNIGKAHIGFFSGLEQIAEEKGAIFRHAARSLLDAESEWFGLLHRCVRGEVKVFRPSKMDFSVEQPGAHMRQNACLAAAIGQACGLSDEQVREGLAAFRPAPMRWHRAVHNGIVFINDAYNANPLSMRAAISTFADLPCAGRRVLVVGGMRELGDASEAEHRELGGFIDSFGFERVVTIGELGAQILCEGIRGTTKEDAFHLLREFLQAGDMVLLKASRGEQLETLFNQLTTDS